MGVESNGSLRKFGEGLRARGRVLHWQLGVQGRSCHPILLSNFRIVKRHPHHRNRSPRIQILEFHISQLYKNPNPPYRYHTKNARKNSLYKHPPFPSPRLLFLPHPTATPQTIHTPHLLMPRDPHHHLIPLLLRLLKARNTIKRATPTQPGRRLDIPHRARRFLNRLITLLRRRRRARRTQLSLAPGGSGGPEGCRFRLRCGRGGGSGRLPERRWLG